MKLEMEKIYEVLSAPFVSHHVLIKDCTVLPGFKYSSYRIFHLPAALICSRGASGDLLHHLILGQIQRGYACSTACLICHYLRYINLWHPSDT